MHMNLEKKSPKGLVLPFLSTLVLFSSVATAETQFNQINLVTDDQSVNSAKLTDTKITNAWGISYSPTGPFWISDNGTGVSTVYSVNATNTIVHNLGLTVTIPGDGTITGQVYNKNANNAFNGNTFLFVSEDGTISGWSGPTDTLQAASSNNVYKGVAIGDIGSDSYLYAANFKADRIDVIKGTTTSPDITGNFIDPTLPAGYAPFNIQNLAGNLYVTYAEQDITKHDEIDGLGKGYVDEFDLHGNLITRVASEGTLDAPWGLAIAPSSFGDYKGDLLVGNFGDGKINAYNPLTFAFIGQLLDSNGQPLSIQGLWGLSVGNGGSAGSTQSLYFTAGSNGESNGLFGAITPVPVPSTIWLFGSALMSALCVRKGQCG